MQIENSFDVDAPADRVFAFLLDVNRVVGCVPGAELAEVVDPEHFKGKVKIKVGPITVAYNGSARIASRDDAAHTAVMEAEGRETTGAGQARATATMRVVERDGGATVTITTDYTVAGRVAQFGRGVMEDVSKRLVSQMSGCIKSQIEGPPVTTAPPAAETGASPTPGDPAPVQPSAPVATAPAPAPTQPVNALALLFAVLWDRLRRLFGGRKEAT